ncbi:MAG: hypothetical protein IAF08_13440, partial [Rhizobacter sp.]|nr:hypothetical protein [Chlorobiales bacterium]
MTREKTSVAPAGDLIAPAPNTMSDKARRAKLIENLTAAMCIAGIVALFFRNLFFGEVVATNDVGTNDLLYLNLPLRALYGEALKQGELLQWMPFKYGGFPVFAEGEGGFLHPFNLIVWFLLPPVSAMNLTIIFHAA